MDSIKMSALKVACRERMALTRRMRTAFSKIWKDKTRKDLNKPYYFLIEKEKKTQSLNLNYSNFDLTFNIHCSWNFVQTS